MRYENEFILSCCKYLQFDYDSLHNLYDQNLDMIYVLGQVLYNRIGGVVYHVLQKSGMIDKLNREFVNSLRAIYETNIIKSNSFNRSLNYIGDVFNEVDFPYALLKGSYLSCLYLSGMRTSNDIDILISFRNISKVSKLLLDNGFVQGYIRNNEIVAATRTQIVSSEMNRGETVPFIKEVNYPHMKYLEVDVNFSLDFKPEKDRLIVDNFLQCTVADIKTENGYLHTLAIDDFLIQLCVHIYKEAAVYNWVEFGRDQGLYKYVDIYLLLNTFGNIVNYEKINELGLQKECYYALYGVNKLFGTDINLEMFAVDDLNFISCIIDVVNKKSYKYEMDFVDWIFCAKRKEMLHEFTV